MKTYTKIDHADRKWALRPAFQVHHWYTVLICCLLITLSGVGISWWHIYNRDGFLVNHRAYYQEPPSRPDVLTCTGRAKLAIQYGETFGDCLE